MAAQRCGDSGGQFALHVAQGCADVARNGIQVTAGQAGRNDGGALGADAAHLAGAAGQFDRCNLSEANGHEGSLRGRRRGGGRTVFALPLCALAVHSACGRVDDQVAEIGDAGAVLLLGADQDVDLPIPFPEP